ADEDDLITRRNVLLTLLNQIGSVVVRISEDAQDVRLEIFIHGAQGRNVGTAGNAPGRPEIQKHYAPAQIFQVQKATVKLSKLHVRSRRKVLLNTRVVWRFSFGNRDRFQMRLEIRQPCCQMRTCQQRHAIAHHEQADQNQNDAGDDFDFVQMPSKLSVETQKLINAQTGD